MRAEGLRNETRTCTQGSGRRGEGRPGLAALAAAEQVHAVQRRDLASARRAGADRSCVRFPGSACSSSKRRTGLAGYTAVPSTRIGHRCFPTRKAHFRNPLRQNRRHVKAVEAALAGLPPPAGSVRSVVALVGKARLEVGSAAECNSRGGLGTVHRIVPTADPLRPPGSPDLPRDLGGPPIAAAADARDPCPQSAGAPTIRASSARPWHPRSAAASRRARPFVGLPLAHDWRRGMPSNSLAPRKPRSGSRNRQRRNDPTVNAETAPRCVDTRPRRAPLVQTCRARQSVQFPWRAGSTRRKPASAVRSRQRPCATRRTKRYRHDNAIARPLHAGRGDGLNSMPMPTFVDLPASRIAASFVTRLFVPAPQVPYVNRYAGLPGRIKRRHQTQ